MRPGRAGSGIKKGGFSFFTRNIFRCEPGKGGGDCKIEYFPPRESLVSDIPAGDGNVANLFLQCLSVFPSNRLSGCQVDCLYAQLFIRQEASLSQSSYPPA